MKKLLKIFYTIIGIITGTLLAPFYVGWLLFDHRPRCEKCNERYKPEDGMFGVCKTCVFTQIEQTGEEQTEALEELENRLFKQEQPTPDVPLFDDAAPFVFGSDKDGRVVVRQIDEFGEESWQYVGHDGYRI